MEDQIRTFSYKLKYIPLEKLSIQVFGNKVNVRSISTLRKEDSEMLYNSIKERGLFVPLIVKEHSKIKGFYHIIDGQRRYIVLNRLQEKGFSIPLIPCLVCLEMNSMEAFQLSVEESRTQIKVSTHNLESEIMKQFSKQTELLKDLEENKRINERKKSKRKRS